MLCASNATKFCNLTESNQVKKKQKIHITHAKSVKTVLKINGGKSWLKKDFIRYRLRSYTLSNKYT